MTSAPLLRILTMNVGSLLEAKWEQRRHEVVAWIDHLDPHIVCLQEIWESSSQPNTAGWVAEAAAANWEWAFGGDTVTALSGDPTLRFGSAVLSKWSIDSWTYHRLGVDEATATDFIKAAPWELFHVETAGLDVFSTHLAPAPTDLLHRRVQVQEIDGIIGRTRGAKDTMVRFGTPRTHFPAILCGDFNAEPESDEIRFLTGHTPLDGRATFYQDAWRVAGSDEPGWTQDWRTNPTAAELNVHRKRIDYVFIGDPFQRAGGAGRIVTARVVADRSLTGGVIGSDHAGVFVEAVWPDLP